MSELEPTRTYSNPTETDVLRRLLDERGVEHYDGTESTLWLRDGVGYRASADEGLNGFMQLHLWCTTPEQAIAATLGTGTCKVDVRNGDWYCDACGEMVGTCDPASELFIDGNAIDMWKYCPFCGRRIEQ